MQDVVADAVEEIPFVADDEQRSPVGLQKRLQPQGRFEIEVIARLIEQQHVGAGEQQGCQGNAHAPAAGKTVDSLSLGSLVESQAGKNPGSPRRCAVRVDRLQPFVDVTDALARCGGGFLFQKTRALFIGGKDPLERRVVAGRNILGKISETGAAPHVDRAGIGLDLSGDDLHQCRLACAVAPDQADPASRDQRRGSAVKDRVATKPHGNAGQCEHGRLIARLHPGRHSGAMSRRIRNTASCPG